MARPVEKIQKAKIDTAIVLQVATPVVVATLVAVFYFVHLPGIQAAGDVIDALRESDPESRLEIFQTAFARESFAQQELTEQLSQQAMTFARDPKVPAEIKDAYLAETQKRLEALEVQKPGDARVHVFIGSYYRSIGDLEKAEQQMQRAHELSPEKQTIIIQQGFIELSRSDNAAAMEYFKQAFELDERNLEAREYYAASLFYLERGDEGVALMDSPKAERRFAASDFIISTANQQGRADFAAELFEIRTQTAPDKLQSWRTEPQTWATLAFLYYQLEDSQKAIATLNAATEVIPTFAPTAQCFSNNIESGNDPQEDC